MLASQELSQTAEPESQTMMLEELSQPSPGRAGSRFREIKPWLSSSLLSSDELCCECHPGGGHLHRVSEESLHFPRPPSCSHSSAYAIWVSCSGHQLRHQKETRGGRPGFSGSAGTSLAHTLSGSATANQGSFWLVSHTVRGYS